MASTTPAMNALQFSCDSSRGTEIYFVRMGSLSEIMTVIGENWMRQQILAGKTFHMMPTYTHPHSRLIFPRNQLVCQRDPSTMRCE